MSSLLDRALAAEDAAERERARAEDLEARLRGVLNNDPETATRALSWLSRTQNAETLLLELRGWLDANPSVADLLPTGFASRLTVQLKTVAILKRDQEKLAERPPEDEWWETWKDDTRFGGRPRA